MGLRCLIGHDFSERKTEREREERGREVVVTVREYRECNRCGDRRIISENKEVTAESAADEDEGPSPVDESPPPEAEYEEMSAVDDDGVILDDEPSRDDERAHGEWPDSEAEKPEPEAEPRDWPEVPGEDEGFDAEPDNGTPAEGVQFRGSLTPERTADADPTVDPVGRPQSDTNTDDDPTTSDTDSEEAVDQSPTGIRRAAPSPTPTGQQRLADMETEFVCPECGYTTDGVGSSLRPGDICPECRRGYLSERER